MCRCIAAEMVFRDNALNYDSCRTWPPPPVATRGAQPTGACGAAGHTREQSTAPPGRTRPGAGPASPALPRQTSLQTGWIALLSCCFFFQYVLELHLLLLGNVTVRPCLRPSPGSERMVEAPHSAPLGHPHGVTAVVSFVDNNLLWETT
jgi:hypothetical protein